MNNSSSQRLRELLKSIQKIDYINPEDIPNIDLYMDQVTTFMDHHLASSKRFEDDKILTKTMINNYTKNKLLPPPEKKKYSKEHMLLLIFIYYFKNFLSISDIQSILSPLTELFFGREEGTTLEQVYQELFELQLDNIDVLTKDIMQKWKESKKTFPQIENEEEKEFLSIFSFICTLSFDVWVKKTIIDHIIDHSISTDDENEPSKKEKSATESSADKP